MAVLGVSNDQGLESCELTLNIYIYKQIFCIFVGIVDAGGRRCVRRMEGLKSWGSLADL